MKKHYAVIGDPIEHSRSPELYAPMFHKAGIDADFLRLRVTAEELFRIRETAQSLRLSGFAVTMPHKRAIIPFLDRLAESAEKAGSVNIVTVENGVLTGHNTDGAGLVNALRDAGVPVCGGLAVILGNGGAAAGARSALEANGAAVSSISREHRESGEVRPVEEAILAAESAEKLISRADILINATPLGMENGAEFSRLDFVSLLKKSCAVFDMVYRADGDTRLIKNARQRGLSTLGGRDLLYHQGLLAFRLWTGGKS